MANLRVDKITSTETFETTGSVDFDGSGDFLSLASSSDFGLGTGDFTIEAWVCPRRVGNSPYICEPRTSATQNVAAPIVYINTNRIIYASNMTNLITGRLIDPSEWFHVAAVRHQSVTTLYANGVSQGSIVDTRDYIDCPIQIGQRKDTVGQSMDGFISNFRMVKGKAIYTANFKPPMRELEVTPETVILACQSKTDAAHEKTGKTITVNGNAVASELTPGLLTPIPKDGGSSAIKGSVEFSGSGDYMTVTETEDFDFGTGDFTIEYWYWESNNSNTERRVLDMRDSTRQWMIGNTNDNGGKIFFEAVVGGVTVQVFSENNANTTSDRENWRHLAVVRNGNTLTIYLDGVNKGSGSLTGSIRDDQNTLNIGRDSSATNRNYQGFLSNLRIVKGTALYTDDFIPPTRELKKVPGTVLLCCQDPVDPLKEATGKTIDGHGTLYQLDSNVDLAASGSWVDGSTGAGSASYSSANNEITMQGNDGSNRGIISKTITGEPGITYQMSFTVTDASTNGKLGLDSNDDSNDVLDDPTATLDMVHFAGSDLDGNTGSFSVKGVAKSSEVVMYFQEFGAAGTTEFKVKGISLNAIAGSRGASNFTPQVGDDRKVTLEGVSKVNSDAYFYLPTGDTYTRDSRYGRGLIVGGSNSNAIEYINITTQSNSQDFGDLRSVTSYVSACSSSTRGICVVSRTPSTPSGGNTIDYVTLATTGNSEAFGESTVARYELAAASNNTRGLIAGGYTGPGSGTPANSDVIDYVTIASTGDAIDFGNLTHGRRGISGLSSPIRACFAAGYQQPDTTSEVDIIDYVTIASTGNALDFGNLSAARWGCGSMASSTRGMWAGGIDPNATNAIDYVTISSKGNVQDFGDLTSAPSDRTSGGMSNSIRGVVCLGGTNSLNYITISTTGNAEHFGDAMRSNASVRGGCSDSHGGLG